MNRIPGLMGEINKSNCLIVIIGLAVCVFTVTVLLPISASADNPFVGTTSPATHDPANIHVDPPRLEPGVLPRIDPITLPHEPKPASRSKNESVAMQTVTGVLRRVAGIGGETTGWAIRLDSPLKLSKTKQVNKIEVAADSSLLESLLGKQVEVRGRITWRQGIERGRYPVMMLDSIRKH